MMTMMTEPLILVATFFLLYLKAIIYVRLDFSITLDEGAEARTKVQKMKLCEIHVFYFCRLLE